MFVLLWNIKTYLLKEICYKECMRLKSNFFITSFNIIFFISTSFNLLIEKKTTILIISQFTRNIVIFQLKKNLIYHKLYIYIKLDLFHIFQSKMANQEFLVSATTDLSKKSVFLSIKRKNFLML